MILAVQLTRPGQDQHMQGRFEAPVLSRFDDPSTRAGQVMLNTALLI